MHNFLNFKKYHPFHMLQYLQRLQMSDLNIRKVPDDLIRALKIEAAENGKTLRDVCIERLERVFQRGPSGKVSTPSQKGGSKC
jgi:hypothetical protein